MDSNSMFVASIISAIIAMAIWAAIIYNIIASASRSKKIEHQLEMQTVLLAKIADKHGVPDSEIQAIVNPKAAKKSI